MFYERTAHRYAIRRRQELWNQGAPQSRDTDSCRHDDITWQWPAGVAGTPFLAWALKLLDGICCSFSQSHMGCMRSTFHERGHPKSWMVYDGKSKKTWMIYPLISGNLDVERMYTNRCPKTIQSSRWSAIHGQLWVLVRVVGQGQSWRFNSIRNI